MPERIAIKQLTDSDLTFFESQFRRRTNIRQKAINLNADVFTGELYPELADLATATDTEIKVSLTIFGPGKAGPYPRTRAITKAGEGYKNWRLNGEFIPDPELEPGRFSDLRPGDLAVMEFTGYPRPDRMRLVVIALAHDPDLHVQLASAVPGGRRTMVQVRRYQLGALVDRAGASADHPIRLLLDDPDLRAEVEDAAFGSASAATKLRKRAGRRISSSDLVAARRNAERIGVDGEALVNVYLERMMENGRLTKVAWVSQSDAAAPYDFEVVTTTGETIHIDAKSTEGAFGRTIHLSAAEVTAAAEDGVRYDLYRIFGIDADGAKLKIAENTGGFARRILAGLNLPLGVRPDSFSLDPEALSWGDEQTIERPD